LIQVIFVIIFLRICADLCGIKNNFGTTKSKSIKNSTIHGTFAVSFTFAHRNADFCEHTGQKFAEEAFHYAKTCSLCSCCKQHTMHVELTMLSPC